MLESVSEEIRNCYAHADTCARQAAEQTDPKLRKDLLEKPYRAQETICPGRPAAN
jgi:hypothetical protein